MYYLLIIQETEEDPGEAQRRPGLHVDTPGRVRIRDAVNCEGAQEGASHKYKGEKENEGLFCDGFLRIQYW